MAYLVDLLLGLAFGFVLQKAGLGEHHRVVGQFRLRDFTMLKFMGTAIVVGTALTLALRAAGLADDSTMPSGIILPALVGGAVLGCGMAVAGMCPGTVLAGIGRGSVDYLVPGVGGMLAGALVLGAIFDPVVLPMYVGDSPPALAPAAQPGVDVGAPPSDGGGSSGSAADSGIGTLTDAEPPSSLSSVSSDAAGQVGLVGADAFQELVEEGWGTVLDVRTKAKFEMFEMPWDAVNVPLVQLPVRAGEVSAGGRILLVASSDDESARAAAALQELGFEPGDMRALAGGTDQWVADGRPYAFNPHIVAC